MRPLFIYLIRHGESEGNVDASVYKHTPDWKVNLTEKGRLQAKEAGIKLLEDYEKSLTMLSLGRDAETIGRPKMVIYTSPWYRARQTAAILNENIHAEIREDPRLREQEWGMYAEEHLQAKIERERVKYGTFFYRMPYGESGADVYDRVTTFMDTLHREFEKKNFPVALTISSHGAANKVILMRWLKWSVEDYDLTKTQENCSILKMVLGVNNKYTLVTPMKRRKCASEPKEH
jgi:broad specificity phosphatase PhoE